MNQCYFVALGELSKKKQEKVGLYPTFGHSSSEDTFGTQLKRHLNITPKNITKFVTPKLSLNKTLKNKPLQ